MTTKPMTAEEHARTALTFLDQSEQEFDAGDVLQGSEKLWGAASHAVLAVSKQRGWPTGSHRAIWNATTRLAQERNEPLLQAELSVAEKFHMNFYGGGFYNPFSESGAMERDRSIVADFVRRVVGLAGQLA